MITANIREIILAVIALGLFILFFVLFDDPH